MRKQANDQIHGLEIPTAGLSLFLPSATIAEIVNVSSLIAVPFAPPWLLGVIGWRTVAVPVVSFEALLGGSVPAPRPQSKVVVLYPLRGRADWEFTGILTSGEPRPHTVQAATTVAASADELPVTPYLATGIRLSDRLFGIPDLDRLRQAYYP
jgi:chemosensory pili system protein ChpC